MILLAALVICPVSAIANKDIEQPHVSVYGAAEIKVVPNEMVWSLNVTTKDKILTAVAQKQMDAVKHVLDFLKELGIEEKKLQTSQMRFGENWKTVDRERVRDGYYATTSVSFTISDFDLYQKIWFGLSGIDSVSIENTSYTHSDRIRYQNESRQKAVLAAREKAIALAATLGSGIAEPLIIEEVSEPTIGTGLFLNNTVNFESTMAADYTTDDILALGTISINTRVRVVFKLKNP
jgi:uncharacterized protein YggE